MMTMTTTMTTFNQKYMRDFLAAYPKKTMDLDTLQERFHTWPEHTFNEIVKDVLQEGAITPILSGGTNYCGLPRRFRLVKGKLCSSLETITQDAIHYELSEDLDFHFYYEKPLVEWKRDLPYICKLSQWLKKGIQQPASLQQRSWDIFQDEKYLLQAGKKLFRRLKLAPARLQISEQADPLMLACNPAGITKSVCHHLAVENKAPYYALLPFLPQSGFASLILGYGWKLTANLPLLPQQIGRPDAEHMVWYFGDFDWEGLRIWQNLCQNTRIKVKLACPFYWAFTNCFCPKGKENQEKAETAFTAFQQEMELPDENIFKQVLKKHQYWPQEALDVPLLAAAWRDLAYGAGTLRRTHAAGLADGPAIPAGTKAL